MSGPTIGAVRVCPRAEYEPGEGGFVVEQYTYTNDPDPSWVLPARDERSKAGLGVTFEDMPAAMRAIRAYDLSLATPTKGGAE